MPSSDPQLFGRVLRAMTASGVNWAVLHGAEKISSISSDLDVVCDRPAREVLRQSLSQIRTTGLHPIALWPYDAGGSCDIFLITDGAEDGIQVDIMFDPEGRGRFGLRSDVLLEEMVPTKPYPRVHPSAQWIYLIRKSTVKRQWSRLQSLLSSPPEPDEELISLAYRLAPPRVARSIEATVSRRVVRSDHRLSRWTAATLYDRLVRPVGAWIHLDGPERTGGHSARELDRRLRRTLPHGGTARAPVGLAALWPWWLSEVQPVRLRAGVFLSYGPQRGRTPKPDLILPADVSARQVVDRLQNRVLRRLDQGPARSDSSSSME